MSIRGLFIIVGLALAFVFLLTGCGAHKVKVEGGQTYKVNVHHDPQRTDIWLHRDRKRHPSQSPK